MEHTTAAVIVAAGASTRMGGIPKQFLPLCGRAAIAYTLEAFEKARRIKCVVVVCRAEDTEKIKALQDACRFTKVFAFARGGATRQQSVINGIRCIPDVCTHIAIHDGARPLITPELIDRTVEDAYKHGASAAGVPVKDTIKVVHDGIITDTPNRATLMAIQTPQVFEKGRYLQAVQTAQENGRDYTDDCKLLEALGAMVFVTPGDYENLKLTTPEDLVVAESLLLKRQNKTR